jgi:YVTN family beta-propeller protein
MNLTRNALGVACLLLATGSVLAQGNFVNFEGKQISPIRLSPDGTKLLVVNTPDNRLSVFDVSSPQNPVLMAEIPVGLEPVSASPRNDDEVWVVNEVSDSISVVSLSRRLVTHTIYVPDEPGDVVFANGRAFVTAARKNQIAVFDVATRAAVTNIPVFGEHPKAIVANAAGTRVYATFMLSGNRTTIIPPERAPPQPPPTNPSLPAPPDVSLIVDAADPAWASDIRYTMPDNDVVEINTSTLAVTRYFPRVGTVNFAIAERPGSGELYVANTDARNLARFEPVIRGAFVTNRVSRINVTSGAITHFDLEPGRSVTNYPNLTDKTNALAQPTAIAFGNSGANFFLAAFGSDRIAQVDANTGAVERRLDINPDASGSVASPRTKRGPRGLALKPGAALYVLNRLANSITVVGLPSFTVRREIPIGSHDPTPVVVRNGRGFLFDAKVSGNGSVSCASCHIDADMDMIAWDLGDPGGEMMSNRVTINPDFGTAPGQGFHPMKGPMVTQTLRGLLGMDPLHWRGDRTNFLHFNGAFDSLLGGTILSGADMRAYRDYINTIVFQPNPNQNLDRTLPTSFKNGNPRAGFTNFVVDQYQPSLGLSCNTCHRLPTGGSAAIIARQALEEDQDVKVPHLRNIYQKLNISHTPGSQSIGGFGIIHDGIDPDLFTFISRPVFGRFSTDTVIKRNIEAFVLCFDTGTAPAVGHSRTITLANVNQAGVVADWNLLEAQAAAVTNIDLVIKGSIDGKFRGLLYQPSLNQYRLDSTNSPPLTRAQLRTKILNGDVISLMGVPPGTGVRIGINRDADSLLDNDEPAPVLHIASAAANVVLSWTTNAPGYVLEQTPALPPSDWSVNTSEKGVLGDRFSVTNSPSGSHRFFRLRGLQ